MVYAMLFSESVGLIENPPFPRPAAIMIVMLAVALLIVILCKAPADEVAVQPTLRGGMSAAICILGVAWLGNTFVNAHIEEITAAGGGIIEKMPFLLAPLVASGA